MKKSTTLKVNYIPKRKPLLFVQSANMLLHCMKRRSYLEQILREKVIRPRYNEESIRYLGVKNCSKIAFPMICFCDVLISRLKSHMQRYGSYGIALNKDIETSYSIKPINYINPNRDDINTDALAEVVNEIFSGLKENISEAKLKLQNYVLSTLLYTKPIYEKFGGQRVNLFDEREWRYVPDFSPGEKLRLLLAGKDVNKQIMDSYTTALPEKYCLPVWVKDIKYLFVPNRSEADNLKRFILQLDIQEEKKYQLLCKISNFNDLRNDV